MTTDKRRVLIVGAGIGGLAAHLACRQAGWAVQHFERQEHLGPAGAGMILWPNGVKVLQGLGLAARLEQTGCTPDRLVVRASLRVRGPATPSRRGSNKPAALPIDSWFVRTEMKCSTRFHS